MGLARLVQLAGFPYAVKTTFGPPQTGLFHTESQGKTPGADTDAQTMNLYTIGFQKKTPREFFTRLGEAGVKRILDVRHDMDSHAPGFARRENLTYFLEAIGGIEYVDMLALAPSNAMLDRYHRLGGDWRGFETAFRESLAKRQIENSLSRDELRDACLLCCEDKPHHCHRRLLAEYLRDSWGGVEIVHL